jgi:hypothetical protein
LVWISYNGYFTDDVNFFSSASLLNGYNGASTGSSLDFSSLAAATSNNFVDNTGSGQNYFSIQFFGFFYTQSYSGTWTFQTNSDDASYLWIGDVAISGYTTANALFNNGGDHPMRTVSNTISLNANTFYPIRIQYGQGLGNCNIIVTITRPDSISFTNGNGYFYRSTSITTSILTFVPIQNADFEVDTAVVASGQFVYMKPTGWQIASQGPQGSVGNYGVIVISCTASPWNSEGCYNSIGLYYVGLQIAGTYISQYIYAIPSSISFVARLRSNNQNGNVGISLYIGNTLLNLFVVSSTTSWTTFSAVVTNNFQSLPQSLKFTNTYVSNGCSGDCTVQIDDIVCTY